MPKFTYAWIRNLHLYIGLFLSPFIVVFAVSVFFLNHARVPGSGTTSFTVTDVVIPAGIERAEGMERVLLARRILPQARVAGEINYIQSIPGERRLVIPVMRPGVEAKIDLSLDTRIASVSERRTALWENLSYLHRSPGPHNVAIRGNWIWTSVWRQVADATVYLLLFLSISGVYLWFVIRSERKTGLILFAAGVVSFLGVVYAVAA